MRYFLAVAQMENVHRASEKLRVSPGALSKAVTRMEQELGTKLFSRVGRGIRLTEPGILLKTRVSQIVQLEEATRIEVGGATGQLQVTVAGPEVILSHLGLTVARDIARYTPHATFEYQACDDLHAIQAVSSRDAHLGLVTSEATPTANSKPSGGLTSKVVGECKFLTVVGPGHPLYRAAQSKKAIPVETVLKYAFVSPSRPILGKVGIKQSLDGWRDDHFPRRVTYLTTHLKLLESIVTQGEAIAYLPDYYAKSLDVLALKVVGCPYTCIQQIRLIAKNPKELSWMNRLF